MLLALLERKSRGSCAAHRKFVVLLSVSIFRVYKIVVEDKVGVESETVAKGIFNQHLRVEDLEA